MTKDQIARRLANTILKTFCCVELEDLPKGDDEELVVAIRKELDLIMEESKKAEENGAF